MKQCINVIHWHNDSSAIKGGSLQARSLPLASVVLASCLLPRMQRKPSFHCRSVLSRDSMARPYYTSCCCPRSQKTPHDETGSLEPLLHRLLHIMSHGISHLLYPLLLAKKNGFHVGKHTWPGFASHLVYLTFTTGTKATRAGITRAIRRRRRDLRGCFT